MYFDDQLRLFIQSSHDRCKFEVIMKNLDTLQAAMQAALQLDRVMNQDFGNEGSSKRGDDTEMRNRRPFFEKQ